MIDKYREWLSQISYRPGFTFELVERAAETCVLVTLKTVDVAAPAVEAHIQVSRGWLGSAMSEQQFFLWVASVIRQLEDHERAEWLRYGGLPIQNPHPELGPRALAFGGNLA
jgi:hypothetical protein